MIQAIKKFFNDYLKFDADTGISKNDTQHALQLATAALLIEMTQADFEVKKEERAMVIKAVQSTFNLSKEKTEDLILLADQEVNQATSYYEFTSLINKNYSPEQKIHLVEMLWLVAFADKEMEKYEEHLVRKISDLLYVSHKDFIVAKFRAQNTLFTQTKEK